MWLFPQPKIKAMTINLLRQIWTSGSVFQSQMLWIAIELHSPSWLMSGKLDIEDYHFLKHMLTSAEL